MAKRVVIFAALAVAGLGAAPAFADPISYSLVNVVFDDGGTVSGTFSYDFATTAYTAVNIVSTATVNAAGNAHLNGLPGVSFPGATYNSPISPSAGNINGLDELNSTSTGLLDLVFATNLSPTGTTNFRLYPGSSTPAYESRFGTQFRDIVSGSVVAAVPLPASAWLLMSGLTGLLLLQRRGRFNAL